MHTVRCDTLGEDVGEQSTEAPRWVLRYLLSWWGAKGVSNGSNCQPPICSSVCANECGSLLNVRLKSTAVRLDIQYVCCGRKAVTTVWLESWEASVSAEKLEPLAGRSQRLPD